MAKRMKVASIAHSVLFIFMSLYFLLTSENPTIAFAMTNIFGEFYYNVIHSTVIETAHIYTVTMAVLFAFEMLLYVTIAFMSVLAVVKLIQKIFKNNDLIGFVLPNYFSLEQKISYNPEMGVNKQGTYLVLSQLRN